MVKRALVISGGGSKGAWGVGVAKALVQEKGHQYSTVIGTSTGSLMGPLILGNDFSRLEEAYTSVTQKDIFNVNPFKKNGDMKTTKVIFRLIGGKETLGESENLRDLIKEFFNVSLFNKLRNNPNLKFGATVTSLTSAKSEVKYLNNTIAYNDIVDWIWASANTPMFMSNLDKDNEQWVDGGLKDFVSIREVVQNGLADEIDVIIHNTRDLTDTNWNQKGIVSLLLRIIGIFSADVAENDISTANLLVDNLSHEIPINFYFMKKAQTNLIGNSLVFDKDKMQQILQEGFDDVVNDDCDLEQCKIGTDGKIVPFHGA